MIHEPLCVFESAGDGTFICSCGTRSSSQTVMAGPCMARGTRSSRPAPKSIDDIVEANGTPQVAEAWSKIRQAKSLVTESLRWAVAGCPTRTAEEVKQIGEICAACPNLKMDRDGNGRCGICGCMVASDSQEDKLKLLMATTKCPDNPPRW